MNIYKKFEEEKVMSRHDVFNMAETIWKEYIKLSKEEKVSNHNSLLYFIEKMMTKHENTEAWSVCFAPSKKMFKEISVLEKKVNAIKMKNTYLSAPEGVSCRR